jgi:hypothetical protein
MNWGPLSVLQEAESYLLSRLPQKDISPFLFSVSAEQMRSTDLGG